MWATAMVMRHPLGQDTTEMPLIERHHPIKTRTTRGPDQAFASRARGV
jgi:hypothetical protein